MCKTGATTLALTLTLFTVYCLLWLAGERHGEAVERRAEQSYCGGYYHHELVRTPDGWKSQHLVEENVWFVNRPGG